MNKPSLPRRSWTCLGWRRTLTRRSFSLYMSCFKYATSFHAVLFAFCNRIPLNLCTHLCHTVCQQAALRSACCTGIPSVCLTNDDTENGKKKILKVVPSPQRCLALVDPRRTGPVCHDGADLNTSLLCLMKILAHRS